MKKLVVLLTFTLLASGFLSAQQISKGGTAWVSSKTAALKSSTWFFAGTKGTLQLGDQVSVLQINGNWAEVKSAGNTSLTGWISTSNLSARRIVATNVAVTASEVSMAGKGFSQEVENSYKTTGNFNYDDVDKTEKNAVSPDELYKFVADGRLVTGE